MIDQIEKPSDGVTSPASSAEAAVSILNVEPGSYASVTQRLRIISVSAPCIYMEELDSVNLSGYDCVIVDEAQFLKKEQVWRLVEIVDDMNIPVICYGLRADFQGNLFEGSTWLMAWADTIEEIKTVCWCGRKAICNARVVNGKVAREGEQIVLGAGTVLDSALRLLSPLM